MTRLLTTLPAFLLLLAVAASAEEARWLRYPAIDPEGTRIAFTYRGDLWIVPVSGGEARTLTTHVGYENRAVWSPDGKSIAFASDRHGNFDLFLVPSDGGTARRLTFHAAHDLPCCFTPDGKEVLFTSRRLDAPEASIGSAWLPELYAVPVEGGRPRQVLTTPAMSARLSPDGTRLAYHDLTGYENRWRKHHTSPVARDLWIWDSRSGIHTKLTEFRGEDRNPVWSPDGGALFYLSEKSGCFNVWTRSATPGGEPSQVTSHGPHPVRFLSIARDGTLAYAFDGGLWVRRPGQDPVRLTVEAAASDRLNARRREVYRKDVTEMTVAPNEEEIAFVVRGEVFVASVEHGTTKRLTFTPQQERSLSWAPDGRSLFFAAERGASWDLHKLSIRREGETHFFRATVLEETVVLAGPDETFQPKVSPDGKRLAYLHNRDEIRLLDLESGAAKALVPAARNYSYRDGDIGFEWSPDSRWLAFNFLAEGRWNDDIGIVDVESGAITNLTPSGYDEWQPRWSADGTAVLFYSNRFGRRSHGSWGAEGDLFALDLTQAAHDKARLSVEEYELLEKEEENGDDEKEESGEDEKRRKHRKRKERPPPEPVKIELDGLEERLRRITLHSAPIEGYALSPDGEKVVYLAELDGKWDLWVHEIRKQETRKLAAFGDEEGGTVEFSWEGETVFVRRANGAITRVLLNHGKAETKPVGYAAEMEVDAPAERAYIFEHAWRQLRRKFYDPALHGVDWASLKEYYGAFLPSITNNHDFAELLSEMLGELNASHTGAGYRIPQEEVDATAALGLLFDVRHTGDGWKVVEVLRRGPCDKADGRIAAGALITHLDGVALTPALNPHALLNHREGKRVLLAGTTADGQPFEQVVEPISLGAEAELLYERWIRQRRARVDALSKGRLGYVHVRGMNDRSFRHLFQEVLGRYGDREGLIVDTRFNGGGWLHDDLVKFLDGEAYGIFHPRGKERGSMGGEPSQRWAQPAVVVQNEANYSDAHIFPYAFQRLGLGKLVGTRVAGTGTAVWWERQIDPTLVFGIPQVGFVTPEGRYLENLELVPDVEVVNDANARQAGRDPQLERAVEVLLEELDSE